MHGKLPIYIALRGPPKQCSSSWSFAARQGTFALPRWVGIATASMDCAQQK